MVDGQDLVIDDAFNEVEAASAHQEQANEEPSRPRGMRLACSTPEQEKPRDGCHVRKGMEDAIPERIHLQARDRIGRVIPLAGQHVMPLQDLVQDNAIKEPAKPDTQEQTRPDDMFSG